MHEPTADIPVLSPPPESLPAAADSDTELVMAARSGDRAAFARLYRRYAPVVHAVLLARVNRPEAEDITQDVFLKAMRSLHTLREPAAIGPWLITIARRRATSLFRRLGRLRFRPLEDAPSKPVPNQPALPTAHEILGAIRELPEAYRETLILRLVERLGGAEIAARTGMTHGSVRVNLTRGMKLLRERLGSEHRP